MKMRRKNKKKANSQNTKQEQRACFNAFKRRIISYLNLLGCEEVVPLIDNDSFHSMYKIRNFSVPKIKMAKDLIADREIKNDVKNVKYQDY